MHATRICARPENARFQSRGAALFYGRFRVLVLSPMLALSPASAGDAPPAPARGLTIAILDLAEIPEFAPPPSAEARRPAWRTTFGSERETVPESKASTGSGPLAALAGADAVLIQGVRASARLRRLFPPRAWRLIVSRKVLSLSDPVGFRTARSDLPPSTAIAVKARADLRIAARTHALHLEPKHSGQPPGNTEASATAVRLVDARGRTLWLASVALPAACASKEPPCPALDALDAWRKEKLANDEPTVIGGRITAVPRRGAEKNGAATDACVSHTVESDLSWQRLPPASDNNSPDTGGACIEIVRLAD